ncbi:AMP-binding protein [Microbacterium sp.]|uniref:AMP-binding protein n=1 Tax=Microbacterium sp. TaxID=51671 RepID=UPI002634A9ED|nr:AMP-binding protein [Microbacterium sp.]
MTNRVQDDTPQPGLWRLIRLNSSCGRNTEALLTTLRDALAETPDAGPEPAVIVETSGSSGYPKSVVLPISALRASAEATAERIGSGSWVLALEPTYVAGLQVLVRGILAGTTPAVIPPSFTAAQFLEAAAGIRAPRYTSLVPAQLTRLLDAAGDPAVADCLRGFAAILVGGQALPAAEADRAAALGIRIVRTYGSSETSGGCVYDGVPLAGVSVRVEEGEVQISGPVLAAGYLDDDERTAQAFVTDADGTRWYRTGDVGEFDGVLRVTGRRDNVIVSGGVNVSLDRVERVVRTVPGLEAAVVVPVADARWGQASVVVVEGDLAAADDALAEARRRVEREIGAPARPRDIVRVERMPLLPSGKPDRIRLPAQITTL